MKTRIISAAVMIPVALIFLLALPAVFLAGAMSLITGCIAFELIRATGTAKNKRLYVYPIISALIVPILAYINADEIYVRLVCYVLTVVMFGEAVFSYGKDNAVKFADILTVVFGGFIIPYALGSLVNLKLMEHGNWCIMLPLVCTVVSDSGAYFAGVTLGKHKGIFKVSPNKSLEGCIGGIVAVIAIMLIYGVIIKFAVKVDVNFGLILLYAVVGNLMTQLGDLAFSLVKREHGIKDYGNLIPGHGGVLDRCDSLIFAAPVIYILLTIVPAF